MVVGPPPGMTGIPGKPPSGAASPKTAVLSDMGKGSTSCQVRPSELNVNHPASHKKVCFTFLGHTFRPVISLTRKGLILFYTPCMSNAAKKEVRIKVRKVISPKFKGTIVEVAAILNPKIRAWFNYYCVFTRKTTYGLWYWINQRLIGWIMEHRMFSKHRAYKWLKGVYAKQPELFVHWSMCQP